MNGRGRAAMVALVVLVIYLIGYAVKVAEDNRDLQQANKAGIARLEASQQNAADVLAKILAQAAQAEQAGIAQEGAVERILERVEGLDPEVVRRAIEEASRQVGRPVVAPGPPGPQGPQGPPGTSAPAATTTSTVPATTTSTTRPPTTTTSATTTTTTRPACTVGLDVPGLARFCL